MKNDKRSEYVTRDSILRLLTDDEVAKVTTAETAARLADGAEYLDLEHVDQGVQRESASRTNAPMGRVLPRQAVHEKTWKKILALVPAPAAATAPTGQA